MLEQGCSIGFELQNQLAEDDPIQMDYSNSKTSNKLTKIVTNKLMSDESCLNSHSDLNEIAFEEINQVNYNMSQSRNECFDTLQDTLSEGTSNLLNDCKDNSSEIFDESSLSNHSYEKNSKRKNVLSKSLPKKYLSKNNKPIGNLFASVKKLENFDLNKKNIRNKRKINVLQKRVVNPSDSKINKMKKELFKKKRRDISQFKYNYLITKCSKCAIIMKKDNYYSRKQDSWMFSATNKLRVNDRANLKVFCGKCSKIKHNLMAQREESLEMKLKQEQLGSDLENEESSFNNLIDKFISKKNKEQEESPHLENKMTQSDRLSVINTSKISDTNLKNNLIMNQIQFSMKDSNQVHKMENISPRKELLACYSVRGTEYVNLYLEESTKIKFKKNLLEKTIPHNYDEDCDTDEEVLSMAINKTYIDLVKGIKKMKKKLSKNKKFSLFAKIN
jgi:hypothetical protein